MTIRFYSRFLICLVLLVLVTTRAHAQTPAITYQRYDTAITIKPDGALLVREIQQIRFDGEFHTAFADIPIALTSAIQNIQIYEDETLYAEGSNGPNTFNSERDNDFIYVNWEYTPTQPGAVRTFVLEYEVVGGLWVYPNQTILEWRAVPADRSGIVVENSVVTVTLPTAVTKDQLQFTAYGPDFQTTNSETEITFTASEPIQDGVQFQVQVGFPPALVVAQRQPWQIQEDNARLDYHFQALNVDLTLEADGTLWVDEFHELAVEAGALDQGYREIPLRFLDSIDQVKLMAGEQSFVEADSGCTYCLQVRETPRRSDWVYYDADQRRVVTNDQRAGSVAFYWQFPPLVRGEATTLHLRYRVLGAVRHFADHQAINWSAVFGDRNQTVESASVRLHLPPGIERNQVVIRGGEAQWQDDGSALLTARGALSPSEQWDIRVTLPVNATQAALPQWQQMVENAALEARQAEIAHARLQLGFGVAAILILLLGLLGVYLIWYLWGRDQASPAIADYLTEPPSDLPPAIVAYLIDETPSVKGALASIFHLANLGLLWIRLGNELALKRVQENSLGAGETIMLSSGAKVALPHHLITLFNALQPDLPYQQETPLHQIYSRFQAALPQVYSAMGDETNRFFDELPPQARHRWLVRGQWIVLLGVAATIVLGWRFYGELGWLAVTPALAAIVAGVGLVIASRWMPRRTSAGVEETQRWLAFRNYLRNLKQYGNVEQAQRILDRYFAYAVALDVEEVVLEQATEMGGALPDWSYTPTWQPPRRPILQGERPPASQPTAQSSDRPTTTSLPPLNLPPADDAKPTATPPTERPSLSGTSRQLADALNNASQSLGTLLSTAAGDVDQTTPFETLWQGTQIVGQTGANVAASTFEILGEILEASSNGGSSGGGGGGYRSSGSSSSSWSSSSSRSSSSSSSSSSSRSSSDRRSGGGGRRGFG